MPAPCMPDCLPESPADGSRFLHVAARDGKHGLMQGLLHKLRIQSDAEEVER